MIAETYPTREQSCSKHGLAYQQIYLATLDHWHGQCDDCKQEEDLEQRARQIFAGRKAEYEKQVFSEISEYSEQQIEEDAEADLSAQLEKWREEFRPQFIAATRAGLNEQVRGEVEQEFLEKIKGELRQENRKP